LKEHIISERDQINNAWAMVFLLIFNMISTIHPVRFIPSCAYVPLSAGLMLLTVTTGFRSLFFSLKGKGLFFATTILNAMIQQNSEQDERARFQAKDSVRHTNERIENILKTLMPPAVVEELRHHPSREDPPSHQYQFATVAQSDLVGFTKLASGRKPEEVVEFIGELFGLFDELTDKYEVYKVETVGDAYIAGQAEPPLTLKYKPVSCIFFGLEMVRATNDWAKQRDLEVSCRVGVHTDKCIGGIVGSGMQRYHLFGELMSGVEVLESTAPQGKVQISEATKVAAEAQMRKEDIPASAMKFEMRTDPHLTTSKGDVHSYSEVGGNTYVVHSYSHFRNW